MNNVYNAMMLAADAIEQKPAEFNFGSCDLRRPKKTCDSPMCAIGWILAFEGSQLRKRNYWDSEQVVKVLGVHDHRFYQRMDELTGATDNDWYHEHHWAGDATVCAATLRVYAKTYHQPPESEWVQGFQNAVGTGSRDRGARVESEVTLRG